MDANLHWSVWLLSGMAVGAASGLGKGGLSGLLIGVAVLCSPVVIYMKAGAALMPFLLFYGGLAVMTSVFFKRRRAKENAALQERVARKKKEFGL